MENEKLFYAFLCSKAPRIFFLVNKVINCHAELKPWKCAQFYGGRIWGMNVEKPIKLVGPRTTCYNH